MKPFSRPHAVGVFALVLMSVCFTVLYKHASEKFEEYAAERIQALALHHASCISDWVAAQRREVRIAATLIHDAPEGGRALEVMGELSALSDDNVGIVLLRGDGLHVFTCAGQRREGYDPVTASVWHSMLDVTPDGGSLEGPVPSLTGSGRAVALTLPVTDAEGVRVGALGYSLPLAVLSGRIHRSKSMGVPGRRCFLVNEDERILLPSAEEGVLQTTRDVPILRSISITENGLVPESTRVTLNGSEYVSAGAAIQGTNGWRIYILSPLTHELSALPAVRITFAGAWVCIFFIVALLLHQFRKQEHYKELSEMDHLTGAGNRLAFETAMASLSRQKDFPVCLIVMDVDGLKLLNDSLGHEAGDALLRRVALLLHRSLRGNDAVYRIGGDEFAILLRGTTQDMSMRLTERLEVQAAALRRDLSLPPVFVSYGLAEAAAPGDMGTLFVRADEAMYRYKNERRELVRAILRRWLDEHPEPKERRAPERLRGC